MRSSLQRNQTPLGVICMAITSKLDAEPLSTDWIISRYGVFITTTQLAKLFGFSGGAAVRRAYSTGRLGIPLMRIEGRRGLFAHAETVGLYLRRHKAGAA